MSVRPYLLAAATGVLLTFSFPRFGHSVVAWAALVPLLLSLERTSTVQAFRLGLTAGVIYFTGTIYWVTNVMAVFGDLHVVSAVLVNAALVAYMALFPALFAVIVRRITAGAGTPGLWAAVPVWVAAELGRTHLFTGFPWVLLGYSQADALPIAQLASLFGVYALSGLVVGVNVAIVQAVRSARNGVATWNGIGPLIGAAAAILLVASWGSLRMRQDVLNRSGEPVRVGLVQGNVAQEEKWSPARADAIYRSYLQMSRDAIEQGATLVLWPESAVPFTFDAEPARAEAVRALARQGRVQMLVGSDEIERGSEVRLYNSAYLLREDGVTAGVYRKMHLVPFGEYVPLKRLLFFAAPLVEAVSAFSPGAKRVLLPVAGHPVSAAICYEIVYPDLVRRFVKDGSELLTTITNDAWFGQTSAPYQHFAQASMRAIETGRYLVRAANTGISAVVDPYGRVMAESRLFEPAVIVRDVRFLRAITLYVRIGDAFAYACVLITIVLIIGTRRRVE